MAKPDASSAALRRALRDAGLRATGARASVLKILMEAGTPLSHSEVYERLADQSVDRVTVYRNLTDLAEAGLLNRTDLGDHVWRFEWREPGPQGEAAHAAHPHFLCSDCGAIACLPLAAVSLKAVRGTPRSLRHHQSVEIRVRGLCDACV